MSFVWCVIKPRFGISWRASSSLERTVDCRSHLRRRKSDTYISRIAINYTYVPNAKRETFPLHRQLYLLLVLPRGIFGVNITAEGLLQFGH